ASRRHAEARYSEIETTARGIIRALQRKQRRNTRVHGSAAAIRTQAVRQVRGLERALRLERRRDYFRATGRAAATAAVSEAVAAPEPPPSGLPERGGVHALGH